MKIRVPKKAYLVVGVKSKKAKYHLRDHRLYDNMFYSVDKFFLDEATEIDISDLRESQCCKRCFAPFLKGIENE